MDCNEAASCFIYKAKAVIAPEAVLVTSDNKLHLTIGEHHSYNRTQKKTSGQKNSQKVANSNSSRDV